MWVCASERVPSYLGRRKRGAQKWRKSFLASTFMFRTQELRRKRKEKRIPFPDERVGKKWEEKRKEKVFHDIFTCNKLPVITNDLWIERCSPSPSFFLSPLIITTLFTVCYFLSLLPPAVCTPSIPSLTFSFLSSLFQSKAKGR